MSEPGGIGGARRWPTIRAGLIAILLFFQLVAAIPLPELRPAHLERRQAQIELKRWAGVLTDLGLATRPEQLAALGLAVGKTCRNGRAALLRPIAGLKRITQTGQAWGLFAYPDPYPGRLVIAGRPTGGEWITLHAAPDEGSDPELGRLLRYRRMRGVWDDTGDRPKPKHAFDNFATWVARRALTSHPELDQIEVQLLTRHIVLPGSGPEEPEQPFHRRLRTRKALFVGGA